MCYTSGIKRGRENGRKGVSGGERERERERERQRERESGREGERLRCQLEKPFLLGNKGKIDTKLPFPRPLGVQRPLRFPQILKWLLFPLPSLPRPQAPPIIFSISLVHHFQCLSKNKERKQRKRKGGKENKERHGNICPANHLRA